MYTPKVTMPHTLQRTEVYGQVAGYKIISVISKNLHLIIPIKGMPLNGESAIAFCRADIYRAQDM